MKLTHKGQLYELVIDYNDGKEPHWIYKITHWNLDGAILKINGVGFSMFLPFTSDIKAITVTEGERDEQ